MKPYQTNSKTLMQIFCRRGGGGLKGRVYSLSFHSLTPVLEMISNFKWPYCWISLSQKFNVQLNSHQIASQHYYCIHLFYLSSFFICMHYRYQQIKKSNIKESDIPVVRMYKVITKDNRTSIDDTTIVHTRICCA